MKNIILKKKNKRQFFLRYFYFSLFRKINRKYLMLLKTNNYIQVGCHYKKRIKISKVFLYKTLALKHIFLNKGSNIVDYFCSLSGIKKNKESYLLNFNKIKKGKIDDSFYFNKIVYIKNLVPILLAKTQYNLYDKNYKFIEFFNYINLRNTNLLYMLSYEYNTYNYLYFFGLYNSLKNKIIFKLHDILLYYKQYLYLDESYIFIFFNVMPNNVKFLKFGINNYIKFKNDYSLNNKKILDKYLIRNRMFRAGKFFHYFLEYMKKLTHRVYSKNVFFNKLKYIKMNGNKCFFKITALNIDDMRQFRG